MNKNLFESQAAAPTDTKNKAGGDAYKMSPEESLAQLAATGFLADTFYTKASTQLDELVGFAKLCPDEFVGQVALYARHAGFMKDSPAVLMAYLFGKGSDVVLEMFPKVIDNVKMLSNFVQAVRSAKFGRRSLGTRGKRLINEWLAKRPVDYLFRQSIAKDPSLTDIIKLAHPKAAEPERNALYHLLVGKGVDIELLPPLVIETTLFRSAPDELRAEMTVPVVPFNMIDSVKLTTEQWREVFKGGGYQFTRMNLNTAARQGCLKDPEIVKMIAERLANEDQVIAARQFPYQLMIAYMAAQGNPDLPQAIRRALNQAMEHATRNIPKLEGNVYIGVDCSGSMGSPVTGFRGNSTSVATYADVAALFAACMLRNSPDAKVLTFDAEATFVPLNPDDTVITIAQQLNRAGGGTDCSSVLRKINAEKRDVDLFILISDMESWLDSGYYYGGRASSSGTGTVGEWATLKKRCPNARQVRINISPDATDQLPKRADTLRIGGFSDAVFQAIANFAENRDWISTVKAFSV